MGDICLSACFIRWQGIDTFVIHLFCLFVAETDCTLAGDQLRRDVQRWLSPPDPSMNHDFVWKAHHSGTASWFFESDALMEWKKRGSFLWIHGKRMISICQYAILMTK